MNSQENSFAEGALLLLPGESANVTVALLKRYELPRLIHCGVKIVLYSSGFLHAKAAVRDHEEVLIGSCNLDAFSMWRNWESAVLFKERAIADVMLQKVFCLEESWKFDFLSRDYELNWWEKKMCWLLEKLDCFF